MNRELPKLDRFTDREVKTVRREIHLAMKRAGGSASPLRHGVEFGPIPVAVGADLGGRFELHLMGLCLVTGLPLCARYALDDRTYSADPRGVSSAFIDDQIVWDSYDTILVRGWKFLVGFHPMNTQATYNEARKLAKATRARTSIADGIRCGFICNGYEIRENDTGKRIDRDLGAARSHDIGRRVYVTADDITQMENDDQRSRRLNQ